MDTYRVLVHEHRYLVTYSLHVWCGYKLNYYIDIDAMMVCWYMHVDADLQRKQHQDTLYQAM